jgi:hypothetical protein
VKNTTTESIYKPVDNYIVELMKSEYTIPESVYTPEDNYIVEK